MTAAAPLSLRSANARAWALARGKKLPERVSRETLYHENGQPIGLGAYSERVTPTWRWDWQHLQIIDDVLDRVQRGELRFVMIMMPPRHGKTEKATVRQAAYRLELDPTLRVIITAYNDTLARKFSRKVRRIVRGRLPLSTERNAVEDWETEAGGSLRAVGVGGGITGQGGDLILIDDPIKSRQEADSQTYRDHVWEWFTDDVYTRLEPGAAIVITMTHWHEDDLVGRILASEDASAWTVIKLPAFAEADDLLGRSEGEALCPDRYDRKALLRIKRVIGERSFAALYQQHPAPAEGYIFKSQWWRFYTTPDHPIIENGHAIPYLPPVFHGHLQSWDMSFKDKEDSNPISGQMWSWLGADCYLRDRIHGQKDFVATIAAVQEMTDRHPDAVLKLVEDKANGPAIISMLRSKIQGLVAVEPDGDKVARASAVTPLFEAGNVWFPHPAIAPWILAVIQELLHFPFGATDDDVDSLTQALRRLMKLVGERPAQGRNDPVYSEASQVANARY